MAQRSLLLASAAVAVLMLGACEPLREQRVVETRDTIDEFCVDCRNDLEQVSGLTLESLELADIDGHRATWERVVRRLRAGMMPPADGGPRLLLEAGADVNAQDDDGRTALTASACSLRRRIPRRPHCCASS